MKQKKKGKNSTSTFSKKKKAYLSSPLSVFYTLYTPSLLLRAKDATENTPCVLSQHAARKKTNHTRKKKEKKKTLRFHSQ